MNLVLMILHTVDSLLPKTPETRLLISRLERPAWMERLKRLAVETGEKEKVASVLEAIEMELDAGEIPALKDKLTRHRINWNHIENHLRKRRLV